MVAPMDKVVSIRYCSFCGKSEHEVELLIVAYNGNSPGICNECIDMCNEISVARKAAITTESKVEEPK